MSSRDALLLAGDMSGYLRATLLQGFDRVVADLGGRPAALLARHGLRAAQFTDPDEMLPLPRVAALMRDAVAEIGTPELAYRLVSGQGIEALGAILAVLESAPTMRDALAGAERFLFILSDATRLDVERPPGRRDAVDLVLTPLTTAPEPVLARFGLARLHQTLVLLGDTDDAPIEVHLPVEPDDRVDDAAFFGAPVRHLADRALLRMPARVLDAPISGNPRLHDLACRYVEQLFGASGTSGTASLHEIVAASLAHGPPTLTSVARAMAVHPRTLQRRLEADGTSYSEVVDDVRRRRALRLVTETTMPLARIAGELGYREPATFTRAFRRWTGQAPSAYRHGHIPATVPSTRRSPGETRPHQGFSRRDDRI